MPAHGNVLIGAIVREKNCNFNLEVQMNKTRIRQLAVIVASGILAKKKHIGYNQGAIFELGDPFIPDNSGYACGTVACIGGTADYLWPMPKHMSRLVNAGRQLGLTADQSEELFAGSPSYRDAQGVIRFRYNVTAAQAAMVLFYLAETGKVDWSICGPDMPQ